MIEWLGWGVCVLVGAVGLVIVSYFVVRAGSLAHYRTKLEYRKQLQRLGVSDEEAS